MADELHFDIVPTVMQQQLRPPSQASDHNVLWEVLVAGQIVASGQLVRIIHGT